MTTGTIPSLSEEGWVKTSKDVLSYNLAHYILSDAAQSIAFHGNIINLPETYHLHINDPMGLASAIKTDLERLLGRYFISVDVTTDIKEINPKNYAILIYAAVIDDDNIKHELTRVTETNTSGVRKILEMNNYGDGMSYLNAMP
jgi:hypothetical protein